MQEQLRALITNHCNWLQGQIAQISDTLVCADGTIANEHDAVHLAREQVHQITGTTGTMGFSKISSAAGELEDALGRHASNRCVSG